jgi:hypothetical protein
MSDGNVLVALVALVVVCVLGLVALLSGVPFRGRIGPGGLDVQAGDGSDPPEPRGSKKRK